MTLLFNTMFGQLVERSVRAKHPTPSLDTLEEFKRYVDHFAGTDFVLLPPENRWQVARLTFLAARAKSLDIGEEYGIF